MQKPEIDYLKNTIQEIRKDYKIRYDDILEDILNLEDNDPLIYLYEDLNDRFGNIYEQDKLQICLSIKNIHTGEFFNKFFDCSIIEPKRETTAPLYHIINELNKLEDYELFISCNLYKGCKNPKRTKENVLASRYLYVDIDKVKGSEDLDINSKDYNKQLLDLFYKNYELSRYIKPTKIVASGTGLHLYFYLRNMLYFDDTIKEEYINTLRRLTVNLEGDMNCIDISRILRLPSTFNKKEKFNQPKQVEILQSNYISGLFDEKIRVDYTLKELNKLLDQYEKDHYLSDEDFWTEHTFKDGEEIPFTNDIIIYKPVKESRKQNKTTNKRIDDYFCLSDYEIDDNFPNQYLIQDLLYFMKNRNGYCKGTRRNLLFVFYFCFKQYIEMSYEQSCEYVYKINNLFSEPLQDNEVEELLNYLKGYDLRKGFKNIKVAELLKFNPEEIPHMRGTYSNDQTEKRNIKLDRDRRTRKERYINNNQYIKKKPDQKIVIDCIKNNPDKSDIEISNLLNINRSTVYRHRKSLKK